ncbi:hypothetical protein H4Q26_016382 [Puccinia striiformis f. sp. tritici PST-130]|nr:hypothetical protein H4Q26_016382 [Puccinia striiformis f. sp. tritici PST-130]
MISPKTPDGNINMILKRSVNFQDGFTASPEAIVTSAQAISGQHRVKAVNLPDWSTIGKPLKLSDSWNPSYNPRDSTALTSHPATHIKSGLEKRVLRLLNPIVFEHFLLNTQSRNKFRSWLEQHESPDSSAILKLDQWTDQTRLTAMVDLGPGTSRASVERIKRALGSAEPVVELLLNYRRDGTPFHCLLSIVPLFDVQGQLTCEYRVFKIDFGNICKAEPDRISEPCTQILNAKSEVGVGKGSLHLTKKRLAALMSRLALRRSSDGSECYTSTSDTTSAAGAVGQFDSNALPIEQQYEAFEHVYSRVLIFRREGYQVVYTTPKALRYLVRETPTKKDKHSKTTKAMIKEAIKRGLPISFEGDVILSDSGTQRQRNTRVDVPSGRTTMIHVST